MSRATVTLAGLIVGWVAFVAGATTAFVVADAWVARHYRRHPNLPASYQRDMRPFLRAARIEPKHVGTLYRRAKVEGLIRDTGEREPSNDAAGRNLDKLDQIYALSTVKEHR